MTETVSAAMTDAITTAMTDAVTAAMTEAVKAEGSLPCRPCTALLKQAGWSYTEQGQPAGWLSSTLWWTA